MLHQKIHDHIIDLISDLRPGSMLPTENEIAKKFKVSRLTVHKVMANFQRDGIVYRIKGKGTFLSLANKEILKLGKNRRNGKIIMAYPDWFSEDIFFKVSIAERIAKQQHMELMNIKLSPDMNYKIFSEILEKNNDIKGIILIPPGADIDQKKLMELDSFKIPTVILVLAEDYIMAENIYIVAQNSFETGYMGINYLFQQGHTKFGYVANEPWNYNSRQTYAGMKKALQANNLKLCNLVRPETLLKPGDDSMKAGYDLTKEVLSSTDDVTVLIYDSLPGALSGMRYLKERKIDIPGKISVLSNAEYGNFETYAHPSITSVTSDREAIISKAFEIIANPKDVSQRQFLISSKIHQRESVRNI